MTMMNHWGWRKMRNGNWGCSNEMMRIMRRMRMTFSWIKEVSPGRWGCSKSPSPGHSRFTRDIHSTTGLSWPRKVPGRWECSNGLETPGAPWESDPTSGRWGCLREVETACIVRPLQVSSDLHFQELHIQICKPPLKTAPRDRGSWSFSLSENQNLDQNLYS